jgi:hypothetical protein
MVVRENLGMINTHASISRLKQPNPFTQGTGEQCRVGMLWAETLCCQVRSPGVVFSQDSWQQKTPMFVERGYAGSGLGYRN